MARAARVFHGLVLLLYVFVQAQGAYNYRLIDNRCDAAQCLFIDQAAEAGGLFSYLVGTARVTGHFRTIQQETIRGKTLTCPAFTVTNAPRFFHKAFKDILKQGNTVNRLGARGRLVLAVSFKNLGVPEVQRIRRASRQHQVSLTLFKPFPTESDLPDCGSLFEVLRVHKTRGL